MPVKCDGDGDACDKCIIEMDSKIESLKEYIEETMKQKIEESRFFLVSQMIEKDGHVVRTMSDSVSRKLKRLMFYILPPLLFLLILAMII